MCLSEEKWVICPESEEERAIFVIINSQPHCQSVISFIVSIGEDDSWIDINKLLVVANDFVLS